MTDYMCPHIYEESTRDLDYYKCKITGMDCVGLFYYSGGYDYDPTLATLDDEIIDLCPGKNIPPEKVDIIKKIFAEKKIQELKKQIGELEKKIDEE